MTKLQKTADYETFLSWNPCWLYTAEGRRRLRYYAKKTKQWTTLDILNLRAVCAKDKLWIVLRPEMLDESVLDEFMCWCAETALRDVKKPDLPLVSLLTAKRQYMRGEINKDKLLIAVVKARLVFDMCIKGLDMDMAFVAEIVLSCGLGDVATCSTVQII